MTSRDVVRLTIVPLTWLARLLAGGTFIFSAIAKGVDPWGTIYMMEDYLGAMHLNIPTGLEIAGSFILIMLEFLTGISILLGCFRRSAPIMLAAFMLLFTPLTLWIAIKDPVPDCGCFGEAIVLSNWATFWKNIALCLLTIWLIRFNSRCRCLIHPYIQWLSTVVSGTFIAIISFIGYFYQPLLDFRPYKVGTHIVNYRQDTEAEPDFLFIYEKNGQMKEFSVDDELPDEEDGWKFVERKEIESSAPSTESSEADSSKNLRIWDKSGENDLTEEVAPAQGKEIFLLMPNLKEVSTSSTWQINSLYDWAKKNDIKMVAIVGGGSKEIAEWEDLSLAAYPIYTADDTHIKEVARGNPAVVYTEGGIIKWKSTLRALKTEDFMAPDTSSDPMAFAHDDSATFRNLCQLYIALMAVLIFLSFSPAMSRLFFSRLKHSRDDASKRR